MSKTDTHAISSRVTHFADDETLAYIEALERELTALRLAQRESGFVRLAYDQLVQRHEQEIERAKAPLVVQVERLNAENAELRELMDETEAALDTIYRHASQQPSALSTAIADTCEEMAEKYRAWKETQG